MVVVIARNRGAVAPSSMMVMLCKPGSRGGVPGQDRPDDIVRVAGGGGRVGVGTSIHRSYVVSRFFDLWPP